MEPRYGDTGRLLAYLCIKEATAECNNKQLHSAVHVCTHSSGNYVLRRRVASALQYRNIQGQLIRGWFFILAMHSQSDQQGGNANILLHEPGGG